MDQDIIEFFQLSFETSPQHTLIPRLETEDLVRHAIWELRQNPNTYDWVLDIGTGTGVIIGSVAKNHSTLMSYGGSDISSSIIDLSRRNLSRNNISNVELRQGYLLDPWIDTLIETKNLLLIANLPYIAENDSELDNEVRIHEPASALFGGPNTGLELYEKLLLQCLSFSHLSGKVLFEIGHRQGEMILSLATSLGFTECQIYNDVTNTPRIFSASFLCSRD